MRGAPSRSTGSGLILVVAFLAVLLILAVSFSRMASLERTAGASYNETARARFEAEAGVEFAMGRIRAALESGDLGDLQAPQALDPDGPHRPIDLFGTEVAAIARYPSEEALAAARIDPASALLVERAGATRWESFSVSIRSAQTMIDLNQRSSSLERMLECLGLAIDESDPPIGPGEGRMIVDHRDALAEGRYSAVDDLLTIPGGAISAADLARLRPYVTVDAWIDDRAVRPPDASVRPAAAVPYDRRWRPPHLELEGRAPIDVNAAPKPVLVAAIAGLAGREEVACVEPSWSNEIGTWMQLESDPIDLDAARRVADRILANRAMDPGAAGAPSYAGPFRSHAQFAAFCRSLVLDERFEDVVYGWFRLGLGRDDSFVQFAYPEQLCADGTYRSPVLTWHHPSIGTSMPAGSFDVLAGRPDDGLRIRGQTWFLRQARLFTILRRLFGATVGEVEIEAPGGVYRIEGAHVVSSASEILGSGSSGGGLYVSTRPTRIRFIPHPDSPAVLTRRQAEVLIANADPNARLNKFNPDRSRRQPIDKSDVTVHSTEFCFEPLGAFQIASMGHVHSVAGELLARANVVATVRNQEVWRETTQADFMGGQFSLADGALAPVAGGAGLTTYPQPALADLRETCADDGWLQLSTYEVPDLPHARLSKADFDDAFDLDASGGGATAFADVLGPYAGDLFHQVAPGALHPDGCWAARDATPRYQAAGNMPGKCGTIAFWVKPNWSVSGAAWSTHKFFEATATLAPQTTQSFQIGIFGWGEPVVGFQYEAAPTLWHENDEQLERASQMAASGDAGEWLLVVASYDLDAEEPERAIETIVNGELHSYGARGYNGFSGYDWHQDRTAFPARDVTANANRFSLGGRSGAFIGGSSPADATIDGLAIYDGYLPSEIAARLHAVGRYYNAGDATYTSRVHPGTAGTGVDPTRRVSRIAWTGSVPEEIPGGRLRARVQVDSRWTDWLDDPGGSRVDLPVTGPVRYRIAFEEDAVAGSEPLLSSPDLDDVTVVFTAAPVFVRWDANLPQDQVLPLLLPPAGANDPEPPLPAEEVVFEPGPAAPTGPVPEMPPGAEASAGGPIGLVGLGGAGVGAPPPPRGALAGHQGGARVRAPHRAEEAESKARRRPPRGHVTIEVVDAVTGEPVPRALVTIAETSSGSPKIWADHVHANDRGRLLTTARRDVEHGLTVERTGYEAAAATFSVGTEDLVVRVELRPVGR